MLTSKAFSFLLMLNVAKSEVDFETTCKNDYRTLTNNRIDVLKYCSDHLCIEKCCGEGEMFHPRGTCNNTKSMFRKFKKVAYMASEVDYSKIILFSWDGNTTTKSKKNFVFVKNHRDVNSCTAQYFTNDFFILEDGSIRMTNTDISESWSTRHIKRLRYCIEFQFIVYKRKPAVKLIVRLYTVNPMAEHVDKGDKESIFELVGWLVSSFFLILVLVVYCLLPKLQNLIGLVLMAYTVSFLVPFLVKISILLSSNLLTAMHCKIIFAMLYFAVVSCVFWSNVMSFDVWWALRGQRKRCDMNRRGERVKFMWYCLYAWGAPLLMTVIVTTLDNIDLSNLQIMKLPFDDCFIAEIGVESYFYKPIRILIIVNTILFVLTVYNIWTVKRAVNNCQDSTCSEQQNYKFTTYAKLSVMMGLTWWLEFLPYNQETLWLIVLIELWRLLTVIAIFYLFVCKKNIMVQLWNKFNIRKDFTKTLEVELSQHTENRPPTRTTGVASSIANNRSKDQNKELDLMKNCPKEEKFLP